MPTLLACSACTDAILESRHWWLAVAPSLFLALLLEGAVFALITFGLRMESVSPRAFPAAFAALILLSSVFVAGLSAGLALSGAVLLLAAAWSVRRNFRFSRALTAVRVAILATGLAAGLWKAWPSHRSVDDMLDTALYVARFRITEGWIIDELRTRSETVTELERRVSRSPDTAGLQLHAALGGAPEFRQGNCQRLRSTRASDPEVQRICPQ